MRYLTLTPRTLQQLTAPVEPWMSCDECFDEEDAVIEDLVVHGRALNATFRAHLRSCAACHEEARTLVELAAQDAGADPRALLDRVEIEVTGYPLAR